MRLLPIQTFAAMISCCGGFAAEWRTYEVYQPTVTRHDVIAAAAHPHKYNHCATIAWFQDRWFCLWGSNTHPDEHAPGQRIYVSTSRDGRTWSSLEQPFSAANHAGNPVRYPEGKGHQWQPNLGVVNGELWAMWNQGGSAHDFRSPQGATEDLRGLYFSRLKTSTGRWINRRLMWDGQAMPIIDGEPYQIASTQDLCRLRSGRILAPVTLYATRGPARDAPRQAEGWWALTKRNSVIYSDDLGKTWRLSPGTTTPGFSWIQWEPTVWERPDRTVLMFSRNNTQREKGHSSPTSGQYLLWSMSRDGGETWTEQQFVPLEGVCSRMHVAPLDGRGVWEAAVPGDDYTARRYLMVHNDAPGGVSKWSQARRNIALFFNRGGSVDFVAGNTLTGSEPEVAYPQLWRHENTLAVCYTQGNSSPRSIRVALVSPLPAPDRYYIFPRANELSPPARPELVGKYLAFQGGQHLATREPVAPGAKGFSFAVWIQPGRSCALFDTRADSGPARGFVIALGGNPHGLRGAIYPQLNLPGSPQAFISDLPLPRDGQWHYLGLTVNPQSGEVAFYVDDKARTVPLPPLSPDTLRGATAHIGDKRIAKSQLAGLEGRIRLLALYSGEPFGPRQHAWLYNRLAAELGRPTLAAVATPEAKPLVWLDPRDELACTHDFAWPAATPRGGFEVAEVDCRRILRLRDQGSAGLDLDENHRDQGDRVMLAFRFRIESGQRQTLCTLGDYNQPARLVVRDGHVLLCAGAVERPCGLVDPSGWTAVSLETWGDRTRARVSEGAPAEVQHKPLATWAYLGEAFPAYGIYPGTTTLIDVGSLRTRVQRDAR